MVINMKKIFLVLFLMVISANCMFAKTEAPQVLKHTRLFDYNDYNKITPENVKSLKIIRYTEGGAIEKDITDKEEINRICNYLGRIKITGETGMRCEDNTTIYSFVLKDNSKVSVEIECEWLVLKGRNYKFITK